MSATESSIARPPEIFSDALVVESRFASRRALIADLRAGSIASEVIEAKSVVDGMRLIKSRSIDACILGPTLAQNVAVEFVSQARFETKNRACAFIAVTNPGETSLRGLRAAGIDGTITTPYTSQSFTQMCQVATAAARRRAARPQSVRFAEAVNLQNEALVAELTAREENQTTLDNALSRIADSLLEVSDGISHGKLKLQRNGQPSLATADAIRLAFESGFPYVSDVRIPGSFDNMFVSSLVQWLIALIDHPVASATEELRRTLLEHADGS